MKKVILLSALVLAFSGLALSDPMACTSGTLQSYENLGSAGCTVGNLLFYNFVVVPSPTSIGTAVGNSGVVPITTANNPGLIFNVGLPVNPGESEDVAINYIVKVEAGAPITDSSLAAIATGGAVIKEGECLGGSFSNGCSGGTQTGLVANSTQIADSNNFSATSTIDVMNDISNDGGTISNEQEQFSISDVPEPASLTLLGIGLLGVAFLLRRKVFAER